MDRTETVKTQMKAGEKQYNHDEWIERKTGNKTNDVKKKRQRSQRRQSHIRILRYLEVPKILNSTKQTIYVCTCVCVCVPCNKKNKSASQNPQVKTEYHVTSLKILQGINDKSLLLLNFKIKNRSL